MPFAYWNEATDHVRAHSRIAADVWDCEPYTTTPNGADLPIMADFYPDGAPIIWYPGDPSGHAVKVVGVPFIDEMHSVDAVVTRSPTRPSNEPGHVEVMPFVQACQTVRALARHTTCKGDLESYRGIVVDVRMPYTPRNKTDVYRIRLTADGVLVAIAKAGSGGEAIAVQSAWVQWVECSWFKMRQTALRHGWGAVGRWAHDVL